MLRIISLVPHHLVTHWSVSTLPANKVLFGSCMEVLMRSENRPFTEDSPATGAFLATPPPIVRAPNVLSLPISAWERQIAPLCDDGDNNIRITWRSIEQSSVRTREAAGGVRNDGSGPDGSEVGGLRGACRDRADGASGIDSSPANIVKESAPTSIPPTVGSSIVNSAPPSGGDWGEDRPAVVPDDLPHDGEPHAGTVRFGSLGPDDQA